MEVHTPTAVCGVRGTIIIGLFMNERERFLPAGRSRIRLQQERTRQRVGNPGGKRDGGNERKG